ncbi:MAG: UvrD-helicase domain-containing protein [Rickettsia hoogstraalii]
MYYTEKLLNNKTTHEWLLHKLENEINHILVDEAQDTSPVQWNIITILITEFNAADKPSNSTFIVGDNKQSIFSFQGADLHNFSLVNEQLKANLTNANKNSKISHLNVLIDHVWRFYNLLIMF